MKFYIKNVKTGKISMETDVTYDDYTGRMDLEEAVYNALYAFNIDVEDFVTIWEK